MQRDRYIRASEVGEFLYCHRAWWLRHVEGHEPVNIQALKSGNAAHVAHGNRLRRAATLRRLALLLAGASLLILLGSIATWP